ncbi:MAG TPA: hypothetical protein PKE47_11900, partial [Verrucomicrobiota bacterium]|nr:hypothetical protein [Verrucomicrobiota bacterium]
MNSTRTIYQGPRPPLAAALRGRPCPADADELAALADIAAGCRRLHNLVNEHTPTAVKTAQRALGGALATNWRGVNRESLAAIFDEDFLFACAAARRQVVKEALRANGEEAARAAAPVWRRVLESVDALVASLRRSASAEADVAGLPIAETPAVAAWLIVRQDVLARIQEAGSPYVAYALAPLSQLADAFADFPDLEEGTGTVEVP